MSARGSLDDVIIAIMDDEQRGPLTTPGTSAHAQNPSGQNRASIVAAVPCHRTTPACLDQRAREFEEGKEKGDASKSGEESFRRAGA